LSASKEKNPESGASAKLVKEYTMLAASSKRAGRHDAECTAYLCLGITYDNAEEYTKAIDCYSLVLSICESTQNKIFMGLAYNSIGVDYQLMSSSNREFCYSGSFVDQNSKSLQNAVHFHTKHLEVADDAGKYVAHINLGLTLGSLGQPNEAAKHYQEALRISIRLNSSYGQALAVGNLGLLASRQNDVETATSCMDQHLQLIQAVNDRPSEVYACTQLGLLACRSGDYEKAVHYFDQGYTIAQELGENGIVKQCSCYLGLARGRLQMEAYVKQIVGPLT
jgi:tetratricopeptide (TPR) repeat protein